MESREALHISATSATGVAEDSGGTDVKRQAKCVREMQIQVHWQLPALLYAAVPVSGDSTARIEPPSVEPESGRDDMSLSVCINVDAHEYRTCKCY